MNNRIIIKSLSSDGISNNISPKHMAACLIACIMLYLAAVDGALAFDSASGNPVCGAIKAEGGKCSGGDSSGGTGGSPARDPIKTRPLPADFPNKVKNSGLPLASDSPFSPPQNWPVRIDKPTSPEQRCERAMKKCKDNAACLERAAHICP